MISKEQIQGTIRRIAVEQGVDPALMLALCENESSFQWAAIRYEPAFYRKYVLPQNLLSETEAQARATSWGLAQVMGQVAREFGFKGTYLSELLDPEVCIPIACRKLKSCMTATSTVEQALLRYNGGGDPGYAKRVLDRKGKFE